VLSFESGSENGIKMKRLLNQSEVAELRELNTITARYGLMVNAKVRVADVLPIEGSGISDDLYKYSLMAHFDFLLTNEEHIPQFAVEFDGPTHELRRSKAWDEKKDALCRRFAFPLLRIKINYLPKIYNELSLLKWIIDVYYLQEAFFAAQEKGQIPYDEPFDPFFIWGTGSDGDTRRFPYWISRNANLSLRKLHSLGKVALPGTSGFIGEDAQGNIRGIEYIKINSTHGVLVKSAMRPQLFPVGFTELLSELLLIFTYEKVQEYLVTGAGLMPLATIYRIFQLYESHCKMLTAHSTGYKPPL
jgi:hypothetical protein